MTTPQEGSAKRALTKAAYSPAAWDAKLERSCKLFAETLSPAKKQSLKALMLVTQRHVMLETRLNEALAQEADGIRLLPEERQALELEANQLAVERELWWHRVFKRS
jgi:hypothetical protein